MPCDYLIDVEKRRVLSRAWGVVTKPEIREAGRRLEKDAAFDPTFDQLTDFTGCERVEISAAEMRDLAAWSVFADQSRRAFIVSSNEVFGLTRMFEAFQQLRGAQQAVGIFRTIDEAEQWLATPRAASESNR